MKLLHNNHGQMSMIGAAVGLLITLIIVVIIYYNISASTYNSFPTGNATTYGEYRSIVYNQSHNATNSISNQAATFFTIAPIIAIVIVAVIVIGYVQRIGG